MELLVKEEKWPLDLQIKSLPWINANIIHIKLYESRLSWTEVIAFTMTAEGWDETCHCDLDLWLFDLKINRLPGINTSIIHMKLYKPRLSWTEVITLQGKVKSWTLTHPICMTIIFWKEISEWDFPLYFISCSFTYTILWTTNFCTYKCLHWQFPTHQFITNENIFVLFVILLYLFF